MSFLDSFRAGLKFPLDDFQVEGCRAVEEGRGVLVCAPTGAGKTIVGEFAVALALHRGTKCYYTTPIKALSNQKYHDLVALHGEEAVGLLTGDVSINHDADVVVMTTEVLRNMIYAESSSLDRLSHVVMDEIHFLSDRERGAVWEEVILGLEEYVSVVGLSATVSNSEEFGRWLGAVRGDTQVIVSEHRPVPLNQWMLVGRKLHPLFAQGSNPARRAARSTITSSFIATADGETIDLAGGGNPGEPGARGEAEPEAVALKEGSEGIRIEQPEVAQQVAQQGVAREEVELEVNPNLLSHIERLEGYEGTGFRARSGDRSGQPRPDKYRPLGRPEVLQILRDHDMLPAITFIFSRAGCDAALYQCMRSRITLTTDEEAARIGSLIDAGVADIPEEDLKVLDFRRWRAALQRGFAAHHAGMLPAFRHIVEDLFVRGLLRAVFATETLALGINMPARTVVLEKLVKFDGEAHVDLTPGQYTQLTGRAGRRGIDTLGNAVVQWSPAVDPRWVAGLASTRTYPLNSTFKPGYNMSVNLLKTAGFEQAHRLLEKSFAQFQADGSVVSEVREAERAEREADKLREELTQQYAAIHGSATPQQIEEFLEYIELRRTLSRKEREAKKSKLEERKVEVARALNKLRIGDVVALPGRKQPILAVVIQPSHDRSDPRPWVTLEGGWSGRIGVDDVALPPVQVGHMRIPREAIAHPRRNAKAVVRAFKNTHFDRPRKLRPTARLRPTKEITALREQIREHPGHQLAGREELARLGERLLKARRKAAHFRGAISEATDTLGRTFDRILGLLAQLDYVEFVEGTPQVTDEGERLALIHSECDLLVAQCLKRGIWDGLDPAELAGVVSMCTFENRKETRGEAQAATEAMGTAMDATLRVWDELRVDETLHRLPQTKYPESAFALALHQWAAGAPLGYCLAAAAHSGAELTPGDFVRQCNQAVDLLEKVRNTAYSDETQATARKAIAAIRRGVVALGA